MFTPDDDKAARGTARRAAIHDAMSRALAAGLTLEAAAVVAIAVRDAEPWAGHTGRLARPLAVPLRADVTVVVRPRAVWRIAASGRSS
jgi:uncharacterized protein YggE